MFIEGLIMKNASVETVGSQNRDGKDYPFFQVVVVRNDGTKEYRKVEGNGVKVGEKIPELKLNINVGVSKKSLQPYVFFRKVD
jgi:hypothetical protein